MVRTSICRNTLRHELKLLSALLIGSGCFLAPLVPVASAAARPAVQASSAEPAKPRSFASAVSRRLLPFEPTYLLWQEATRGEDESALEFRYSFKYAISPPECSYYAEVHSACKGFEWFIGFNGEFDFYLNSRPSSPVVSRLFNPSMQLRYFFETPTSSKRISPTYVGLAVQHYSNGQTVEVCDRELSSGGNCVETLIGPDAETLAEIFARDPGNDVFDELSQGLNFVSLEASFRLGFNEQDDIDPINGRCLSQRLYSCWDVGLQVNPYMWSDNNPITWGRGATEVSDFYRARVKVSKLWRRGSPEFPRDLVFNAIWTVGDSGLNTDSLDVSLEVPVALPFVHKLLGQTGDREYSLPLFFEFHTGPLNNLSDYARSIDTWGIGIKFGGS